MEKIRKFLISDWLLPVLTVAASIIVFTGSEVFGTLLFAAFIAFSLAVCDNVMPALQCTLITVCFAIRCKHSFESFLHYWWMLFIILPPVFYYFVKATKIKLKKGKLFYGMLAASVAVTLGGAGIISAKEYFSPVSIFYMIMLGFGMLVIYMFLCGAITQSEDYDFSEKSAKMMCGVIIMLCICLVEEYASRSSEFLRVLGVIPFQWRNNGSTLLMLAMPFAFYLSAKKYGYFFIGLLSYVAILFTGSRGGMIFGLVELGICILCLLIIDKKHRITTAVMIVLGFLAVFALRHLLLNILSYTLDRLLDPSQNSIRLQLIPRGIQDFLANPLFGRGLGYMGNSDVHHNAKFTLCWYHCSFVQVIGSFGVVGIAAYLLLDIQRIVLLVQRASFFNIMMFVSYIGLEMMSFVNPGIFAPFPYLFLVTFFFAAMENIDSSEDIIPLSTLKRSKKKSPATEEL